MPKIQRIRTTVSIKSGRKEYTKHVIVIPKWILKILEWEAGDEITFDFDKKDLISEIPQM
jgi:hypothetical protein